MLPSASPPADCMNPNAPRSSRSGALHHLLVLGAFAVAQPVLDLTGSNAQLFVARAMQPSDLVLLVAGLLMGPGAVLGVLVVIARWIGPRIGTVVFDIALGLLVALVAVPLLKRLPGPFGLTLLALGMVVGGTILAYRRVALVRTFLTFLAPALLVVPWAFFTGDGVRDVMAPPRPFVGPAPIVAPDAPPVVVLVLDELPLAALMDERREIDPIRYPRLAELAASATWFRNATTVYSRTRVALPSMLTGRYPEAHDRRLANATAHPENLFTWLGEGVEMGVVEGVTRLCPDRLNRRLVDGSQPWAGRNVALWRDLGWIYLHVVTPRPWVDRLPSVQDGWKDFGVQVDVTDAARPRMFRDYLDTLEFKRTFGLHFLHVLLPHNPYEYFPSGTRYNDRWTIPGWNHPTLGSDYWADDPALVANSYQRLLLQAGFADRLVGELMDRLRMLELFDQALIMVVADHGLSFRPGTAKRGAPGEDPRAEIMPIPFLVKAPGQDRGRIDDGNVELIDVVPTIADALGVTVPWPVDGQSLLDLDAPRRATKRCGVHRFEEGGGNIAVFDSEGHGVEEALDRIVAWQLETFGSGRTRPHGLYQFGRHGALVGQGLDQLRVHEAPDVRVVWSRPERYADVDRAADELPAHIHGWLGNEEPARHWAIAVNGVVHATTVAYQGADGRWGLSAVVPEHALVSGANRLDALWVEASEAGEVALHRASASGADDLARLAFDDTPEVVFRLDDPRHASLVTPGPDVVFELDDQGGARLRAASIDPRLEFEIPDCCGGRERLVVLVDIESPAETELMLFYQTDGKARFGVGQARRRTLPQGRHRFYMVIEDAGLNGRLRLDPGQHPGDYVIRTLEVRTGG